MKFEELHLRPKVDNKQFNTFKDEFFNEETAFRITDSLNKKDSPEKQRILDGLYGETVIDLGAGESIGGLEFAYKTQAMNYIAVDVESTFSKLPKSEEVQMNIHKMNQDMLSYLRTLERGDATVNNFIISGVDATIVNDKEYIQDVVSEIKNNIKSESSVLVVCPETTKVKNQVVTLNVFGPELEKQGFKVILNINPFTNFWALVNKEEAKK